MESKGYLDFDLRFAKSENGYRAEPLQSPARTAHGAFHLPVRDIEIGHRRVGMRKADSPENRATWEFGMKPFEGIEVYLEKEE